MKFNQLIKGIVKRQEKFAKEKEKNQRSFDRAWEWHAKKHYNIQAKLGERMAFTEAKLGKGTDHPLLCKHDHCEWFRKELVFKELKFVARWERKWKKICPECGEKFRNEGVDKE